jgi:hypothetical protein
MLSYRYLKNRYDRYDYERQLKQVLDRNDIVQNGCVRAILISLDRKHIRLKEGFPFPIPLRISETESNLKYLLVTLCHLGKLDDEWIKFALLNSEQVPYTIFEPIAEFLDVKIRVYFGNTSRILFESTHGRNAMLTTIEIKWEPYGVLESEYRAIEQQYLDLYIATTNGHWEPKDVM